MTESWHTIMGRESFIELSARQRVQRLSDDHKVRELLGPFDGVESPWLEPQEIVPQSDDGVVIALGKISGQRTLLIAVEQKFQGGAIGEVGGAKISQALSLAVKDNAGGQYTPVVFLLETGGVRLQEANLGLNAVAEICSAVLDIRKYAPVVVLVAGTVGSYGGMSIITGLASHVIVTKQARIGLNGPAVIETEAGIDELDSANRQLIWDISGGRRRWQIGLADTLVADDAAEIVTAVARVITTKPTGTEVYRSERLDTLFYRLALIDPEKFPDLGEDLIWGDRYEPQSQQRWKYSPSKTSPDAKQTSRAEAWIRALAGEITPTGTPSVLRGDHDNATYLTVVPDPHSPFPRAREGQVGLVECLVLAENIRDIINEDKNKSHKRAIVAIVDVPSQAYGRWEEIIGLHQAIATTVDAYYTARTAGHPVVALVVGQAFSGGFLAHGLQAEQIIALDDPGVTIHAMHKQATARITRRSVAELDKLAAKVKPLSFEVRDWAQLGIGDLVSVHNAGAPGAQDVALVARSIAAAITKAQAGAHDLSNRLDNSQAKEQRKASLRVKELLRTQWNSHA